MFEFNATLIVAMISFVVFMLVMNAVFYRHILEIIRKRDDLVNQNYKEAKELADKAKEINNEYQTSLNSEKERNRVLVAQALDEEQKKSFDAVHGAKENAKIKIQESKGMIEAEKLKLYQDVDSSLVNELSSQIIKKVIG